MKPPLPRSKKLWFLILLVAGMLPGSLWSQNFPPISFEITDSAASRGYYFISPYTSYATTIFDKPHLILDQYGRTIYYQIFPAGTNSIPTIDFKLQPDGRMSYFDINKGKFFLMDSTFMPVDSIACIHDYETDQHDIQILPNHHYLLFGVEYRNMNLSSYHYFGMNHTQPGSVNALVGGVVIQEFDEGKALIWEWKGHDHYQFGDVDPVWLFNPNKVDWTHANAVELDRDGNILISLRHFNEVTKIDYATGDILWRLGGKQNQFSFLNDPVRFTGQHDIRRVSDTSVSLFDNGQYTNPPMCRAVEYALDEVNKTANLVWEYIYDSSLYSVACGNHQYADNGNHLVDFGFTNNFAMPWMTVVKPDGTKVLEVSMPNGFISYRAFNYTTLPWQLHRPQVECNKTGNNYYLVAEVGHPEYRWSTGASGQSIQISDTGTFWVFVPYGKGYICSDYIRISDLTAPCLYTGADEPNMPGEIKLNCVFSSTTGRMQVHFDLAENANVHLSLLSLQGKEIGNPLHGFFTTGKHVVSPDVSNLKKGMYLLVMTANQAQLVRKVIIP